MRSDPHGALSPPPSRSDPLAVVDPALRVRGASGLRVVDASVLPSIVSGNLNAPVQMIARKAADVIRGVEGLPAERPDFHFDADDDVAVAA